MALTTHHEERRTLSSEHGFATQGRWAPTRGMMTASPTAPTYHLFVGVDIAAASFAASWTTGGQRRERAQTCAQIPDGYQAFQTALTQTGIPPAATLVVLEATGS